jgi:fermentation-respiration switch protein FrsA (DUF1100 family)
VPAFGNTTAQQRAMSEIENRRYNAVRAAGWTFDHGAGVWRHEHTGRTGLNQHVIYECLRNHDNLPLCGNTRAETPYLQRRAWIDRAAFLRDQEAQAIRASFATRAVDDTDWMADAHHAAARITRGHPIPDGMVERMASAFRGGAARHGTGAPQKANSKEWQPNMWEA